MLPSLPSSSRLRADGRLRAPRSQALARGSRPRLALCLLVFLALVSCASTRERLKRQEIAFLEDRVANLESTREELEADPDPEELSDLSVFVSAQALNRVLALADERFFPLEQIDDAYVVLSSIRTDFDYGAAGLQVSAAARRRDLEVSLRTSAELLPIAVDEEQLVLRVNVTEVVPVVRWWFFEFQLRDLVEDLLRVEANEYLAGLPDLRVPLEQTADVHLEAQVQPVEFPTDDGKVFGEYQLPAIGSDIGYTIDKVLVLPDGLHVYLSFS